MLCDETPEQQRVADAFVRFVQAADKMEKAVNWKLRPVGARRIFRALDPTFTNWGARLILRDLDAPDSKPRVQIDGSRAMITVDQIGPVRLRKQGEQWRVVLPLGEQDGDAAKLYEELTSRHEQVARETTAGKHATPEEAAKAFMAGLAAREPKQTVPSGP